MAIKQTDRYCILDASRGSRIIETATTEERAITRANSLTWERRAPIEVKDRAQKDAFGKSVLIFQTAGFASGESRQVVG